MKTYGDSSSSENIVFFSIPVNRQGYWHSVRYPGIAGGGGKHLFHGASPLLQNPGSVLASAFQEEDFY
jgi:hypothetical protein